MAAGIVLVAYGRNAGFASALALAGLVVMVLALIRDRIDSIGGGAFRAKIREGAEDRAAIEDLSAEKASRSTVTVEADELIAAARYLATTRVLDALLRPTSGPLAGCTLHLYEYDDLLGALVPIYEPDPAATSSNWAPGVGVTGEAYSTGSFVLATGEHTHNDTHGLAPVEQSRHLDLIEVAAVPVTNASETTIAIMSVSNQRSPGVLSSPEGYEEILAAAQTVGRVLINLLGTFDDYQ